MLSWNIKVPKFDETISVSPDAKIKIKSYRRNEFLKNELQRFFIQIYTLNISMEEIDLMYKQFIDKLNSKTSNAQL